jgi:hypothetical protein
VDFIAGVGIGYGLSVEATEELKKCFKEKEKSNKIVEMFLKKIDKIDIDLENTEISENQNNTINALSSDNTSTSNNQEQITAVSFTKKVLNMFSKLKDCAPFKETFFSFIKYKLINIGVKGIAYAVGGVIGVLIKGAYDLIKLVSSMNDFYAARGENQIDYVRLGSNVGKIIYYAQNLALRKRKL